MTSRHGWVAVLVGISVLLSRPLIAAEPQVELFSPQGVVKKLRQVTVRFSDAMVPFGDLRLTEPFEINCPAKGAGRWADSRNWIFDFEQDVPAGVRCTFRLKSNTKTLAGATSHNSNQDAH